MGISSDKKLRSHCSTPFAFGPFPNKQKGVLHPPSEDQLLWHFQLALNKSRSSLTTQRISPHWCMQRVALECSSGLLPPRKILLRVKHGWPLTFGQGFIVTLCPPCKILPRVKHGWPQKIGQGLRTTLRIGLLWHARLSTANAVH